MAGLDDDGVLPGSTAVDAALAAARAVCAALDTTLTAHGFQPGQPGAGASGGVAIFCSPWTTFRRRLPALAPLVEEASGIGDGGLDPATACVDLDVTVAVDPGPTTAAPRLSTVRLEGRDLGTVLREVGRPDLAAELGAVLEVPLPVALPRLDAVVGEVLRGGAGVGASRLGS